MQLKKIPSILIKKKENSKHTICDQNSMNLKHNAGAKTGAKA